MCYKNAPRIFRCLRQVEDQLLPEAKLRPSRRSLHARTVSNIMIYTDHCKQLKKEVKGWKGASMTLGDDLVLENTESITGDQVPQEWRDQWWKERGHRFSSRRGR